MECKNTYCIWSSFDQCCNPDENHDQATPNELDCPISLRADFREQLMLVYRECQALLNKCSFAKLKIIRKIIRDDDKNKEG